MTDWGGGALPFKADNVTTCFDSRGCIHWFYLNGDVLSHRLRGSKHPYPISEEDVIGNGYIGNGSAFIWVDGFMVFSWGKKTGKAYQMYIDPMKYKDPSAGAVVELDPKLRVSEMIRRFGYPILICPTLIPRYGIKRDMDEGLFCDRYLNRGAEGGHFNAMRFFSFGCWEPWTVEQDYSPYLKIGDKFDINQINPVWLETLKRRIGQCVERGYTVILTLTDNCSLHSHAGGWWSAHPWNGDNNVNGTSSDVDSVYHFYEDDKQDLPGYPESGQMIEAFIRYVVSELDPLFKPNIIWEICNESHAGFDYHKLIRDWLRNCGVTEDWRVMTSMDGMEYHPGEYPFLEFYKKQMYLFLNYACHGIQTMDEYEWMRDTWMPRDVHFMASEDGLEPIDASNYRAFVKTILEDGAKGLESNERPWWYNNVFNPDLWDWKRIEQIGFGWKDFLNS